MAVGWTVSLNAAAQGLASAVCNGCFGKFITRVILHIFGKEKYGREPNGFESLDVINQMFVDEVKSRLATKDNAQVQKAVASSSSKNELQSLQDLFLKYSEIIQPHNCICCSKQNCFSFRIHMLIFLASTVLTCYQGCIRSSKSCFHGCWQTSFSWVLLHSQVLSRQVLQVHITR